MARKIRELLCFLISLFLPAHSKTAKVGTFKSLVALKRSVRIFAGPAFFFSLFCLATDRHDLSLVIIFFSLYAWSSSDAYYFFWLFIPRSAISSLLSWVFIPLTIFTFVHNARISFIKFSWPCKLICLSESLNSFLYLVWSPSFVAVTGKYSTRLCSHHSEHLFCRRRALSSTRSFCFALNLDTSTAFCTYSI